MRVAVSPVVDTSRGQLVEIGPPCVAAADVLPHRVHLAAGVDLDIDLMAACHWRRLTFPPASRSAQQVLAHLIGHRAAERIVSGDVGDRVRDDGAVPVDTSGAAPWLRVAVVDAVDRWLQLPLDQSLLDAERGVSRLRAASGLLDGPLRSGLVNESASLARRASGGVVRYLRTVGDEVSPALGDTLRVLLGGYGDLLREVGGEDDALRAVVDAGARLTGEPARGRTVTRQVLVAGSAAGALPGPGTSTIDPRQSRARTFAMSADPAVAEVSVASGGRSEPGTVVVRAAAFGARVAPEVLARLMVRLVERGSGRTGGHAPLSPEPRSAGRMVLEARVPLAGLEPADVRADLFDVLVVNPPVDDDDAGLRRARRAMTVLGEWRRLCGLVLMPVGAADVAPGLREAVAALLDRTEGPDEDPICNGAPSRGRLHATTTTDDDTMLAWLRERARPGGSGFVHDTGGLTVAELAAANATLSV